MGSRAPLGISPLDWSSAIVVRLRFAFSAHGLRCFRGCLQLIDLVAVIWGTSMTTFAGSLQLAHKGRVTSCPRTQKAPIRRRLVAKTTSPNHITRSGKVKGWAKIFSIIFSNPLTRWLVEAPEINWRALSISQLVVRRIREGRKRAVFSPALIIACN